MPNRFVKQEKERIIRGILREELDRSKRWCGNIFWYRVSVGFSCALNKI